MSQETIPPSDDDIFISTQIQGKLDEIEDEAKEKNLLQFLHQFANKEEATPSIPKSKNEPKEKPKIKPKRKKATKKLSVTDQMIRKLSGKPHKFRQIRLGDNIQRGDLSSRTPSFEKDFDTANYDTVFTSKEWQNLKFVFNARHEITNTSEKENQNSQQPTGLWGIAGDCPDFDMDDWSLLYGYQDRFKVTRLESEALPPITLSQAYRTSQQSATEQTNKGGDTRINNTAVHDKNIDGIQNGAYEAIDLDTSFGEEVVCSSDEGSIIELLGRDRGTNDFPIVLSSQHSDTSNVYPTPHSVEVKYKGKVSINRESQNSVRMKLRQRSEGEEIIDTSEDEEEDQSFFIQILKEKSQKVVQVPSSPGYECDDETE